MSNKSSCEASYHGGDKQSVYFDPSYVDCRGQDSLIIVFDAGEHKSDIFTAESPQSENRKKNENNNEIYADPYVGKARNWA